MTTVTTAPLMAQLREPMTLFPEYGKPVHFPAYGPDCPQVFLVTRSRLSSLGGWTRELTDNGKTYRWIPDAQLILTRNP